MVVSKDSNNGYPSQPSQTAVLNVLFAQMLRQILSDAGFKQTRRDQWHSLEVDTPRSEFRRAALSSVPSLGI